MQINLTPKHAKMLQLASEGRHPVRIADIQEKEAKSGNGVNLNIRFDIIGGEDEGASVTQTMYMGNDFGTARFLQLFVAVTGEPITDNVAVDSSALIGEELVIDVNHRLYEGRKQADVTAYYPAGTATSESF